MLFRSIRNLALCLALFNIGLVSLVWLGLRATDATSTLASSRVADIVLIPDQLILTGDVATRANTVGQCTESWVSNMPVGSIILGVNPLSCSPSDWRSGSATANVFLPNVYSTTVYTLKLSWPDREGKGLHSPNRNKTATITLDGRPLWAKRTTQVSTFNDYYAAQHEPILTTIVVTQSLTHTLTISVPTRTAWDISGIEFYRSPYPSTTRGIGYGPYRDCQYPGGSVQASSQDIAEDMFRLFHTANAIRTYATTGANSQVATLANAAGLSVFAGAWLDNNSQDEIEIQTLISLANSIPLKGVIVGSEYYLRHRTANDITYLLQRINQVKNGIVNKSLPVMTGEVDNLMFVWENDASIVPTGINPDYRPILDNVDTVLVHIYPFWNGLPIDGAVAFTVQRYQAIQSLLAREYPGQSKRVIIGEAGWPSGGSPNRLAVPSLYNQRKYMLEFLPLADQNNVEYLYFEAFDELWKKEEPGQVGKNWGYSYSDRSAKHDFYGVLVRTDLLPLLPAMSHRVYLPTILGGTASTSRVFTVYTDWPEEPEHFVPSGWMGDWQNINVYACDRSNPHSGEMAFRFAFSNMGPLGWGGIYWQYPENNWGNDPRGIDLRGASRVTFWARSDTPNAQVQFLVGGIGYNTDYLGNTLCNSPNAPYPDSVCPKVFKWITLTPNWTKYSIDLRSPPANLSKVIGGFGWVANQSVVFYLDDIVYEFD